MSFSATLSQTLYGDQTYATLQGFRVLLAITAVEGFTDDKLFVVQDVDGLTTFQHVAQPASLQNVPPDAPHPLTKFMRVDQVSLTFSSQEDLTETVQLIEDGLARLCRSMTLLTTGGVVASITISG